MTVKRSKQISIKISTGEIELFGDSTQPKAFGEMDIWKDLHYQSMSQKL